MTTDRTTLRTGMVLLVLGGMALSLGLRGSGWGISHRNPVTSAAVVREGDRQVGVAVSGGTIRHDPELRFRAAVLHWIMVAWGLLISLPPLLCGRRLLMGDLTPRAGEGAALALIVGGLCALPVAAGGVYGVVMSRQMAAAPAPDPVTRWAEPYLTAQADGAQEARALLDRAEQSRREGLRAGLPETVFGVIPSLALSLGSLFIGLKLALAAHRARKQPPPHEPAAC